MGAGRKRLGFGKTSRSLVAFVVLAGLVISCSGDPGGTTELLPNTTVASEDQSPTRSPSSCDAPGGMDWPEEETVSLQPIGSHDGMEIYGAEYPLPGPTDGLWSQWGQGIALESGLHLSTVGDHNGVDGNTWFFNYDIGERTLTRAFDLLSVIPHQSGAWGYGKVHAQMVEDECGSVWAATYWGTRSGLEYGDGYEGDHLLEIDPVDETVVDRGILAKRRGIPAMAISQDGRTVVAPAVDPFTDTAVVAAYDTRAKVPLEHVEDPDHVGFRSMAPTIEGTVLYPTADGELYSYDPVTQTSEPSGAKVPGDWLRAVTGLLSDGSSYGVTNEDATVFLLGPDGEVSTMGPAEGYTSSIVVDDDEETIYWMPDAHGSAWEEGAPILQMDIDSGEISTLVELGPIIEEHFGLLAGGTYSIVHASDRLIIGVNASTPEDGSGFGTVLLVVIEGL